MGEDYFKLETREDVARFEALSDAYAKSRANFAVNHISLTGAFDYCQTRQDGAKLFTAFLDVFINFMLIWCDTISAGRAWTESFSRGQLEGGSVLDSQEKFTGKMDVHRFNTAFIFRYRALWDKLMGVLVMTYVPNRYEDFITAKSRKKAFRKCMADVAGFTSEAWEALEKHLTEFDNKFRTAESHGTGALRKWSFLMLPLNETPAIQLIGAWNVMNHFVAMLGKSFAGTDRDDRSNPRSGADGG
jgi:hypothetical protein